MEIVREPSAPAGGANVKLPVDRLTLAKRRWRGVAEDGREFGFDLDAPLEDGESFASHYVIAQMPEAILELRADQPARLGWLLGNLHFPIEIDGGTIRVADDAAVRRMLERERVPFTATARVFRPLGGGHHHG